MPPSIRYNPTSSPRASPKRQSPSRIPVVEQLAAIDPDSLTPREALDALYALKGLLR